ncbi:hypothetical protein [Streptomyces sp. NPDC048606]|uniref:hypothetical protein n=1 Tax=Streptomyces sp. NPDC048606 TaxID=3154726 RepID=UPI00341A10FF
MQDLSMVPATPVYSLVIHAGGEGLVLTVDGEEIASGGTLRELRAAGRERLTVLAAMAGRPVRARATDPEAPAPWCMIITPGGAVHDVGSHPAPVAPPPRPAVPPRPVQPPSPAAAPAPPVGRPATPWGPPPPETYRARWTAVRDAHAAGDVAEAIVHASRMEVSLHAEFGRLHPHTVTVMTTRAWLTLARSTDLAGTVELLVATALRRREAGAEPIVETTELAHSAHVGWGVLVSEDPEEAEAVGPSVAAMLREFGWESRLSEVEGWLRARESAPVG